MNQASRSRFVAVWCLSLLAAGAGVVAQPAARVAAIGDSLTDEYAEQTYGTYARSWTELLVQTGRIDMGPRAAGVAPLDYWDEPRRSGFEYNWARYAHTTNEAIATQQHLGAAAAAAADRVDYVIIFIGGNDYAPWAFGTYNEIYYNRWTVDQIRAFGDSRIINYRAMLDAIEPTGAGIVLASIPDFSFMPFVWQVHNSPLARDRVGSVMRDMSNRMKLLARERRLVFVDMYRYLRDLYGSNPGERTMLVVGGVNISMHVGTQAPAAGFVEDIAHPHTVMQSIMARLMVTALNGGFGTGLPDMTEAEHLSLAGLTYGGSDTLGAVMRPMSSYVQNFACVADFNLDRSVGVQDIFDYLTLYFVNDPKADINGSGFAEVGDLFEYLAAYFTPCV